MANVHRVNVNFSESAYKNLTELAERQGKSVSEVLRDAVTLEQWVDEAKREGSRVLIERRGGETREILAR